MSDGKRTILVVDDEETIRDYIRFILERAGYDVIEAENGRNGLQQLDAHHVDLMITDLVMPEKEGLETIVSIKAVQPAIKIIAISGVMNSDTYLKIAGGLGAHATIQKPFKKEQILKAVQGVMGE